MRLGGLAIKNYEIKQAVLNMEQDYNILKQIQNAQRGTMVNVLCHPFVPYILCISCLLVMNLNLLFQNNYEDMRVPGKVQDILLGHSVVHLPHRRPGAA